MRRLLPVLACATLVAQPEWDGYLQNWTALGTSRPREVLLLRNRLRLNSTLPGEDLRAYASLDFVDHRLSGSGPETSLRELYLDLYFERFDLRVGKQQVVWGKADGVFINDIVNPLDLRYFLIQDFEDIRLGLPMVKVNTYFGNFMLEGLWTPKFEAYRLAEPGNRWAFQRPDLIWIENPNPLSSILMIPLWLHYGEPAEPEPGLENGEWGLRLAGFLLGTDFSILYFNGYQDIPVTVIDSSVFEFTGGTTTRSDLYFGQRYERGTMLGLNFARPVGPLLVRGELGYFPEYQFSTQPAPALSYPGPVFTSPPWGSDYFQGMVGLDINGPGGILLSGQYIRQEILDYDSTMRDDALVEMATLLVSASFWNDTGRVRILALLDRTHEAGLGMFVFGYDLADGVSLELGWDLLWGSSESLFGQFDQNDNAYFKLTYSF